ncbi:MAG: glycosyl hydrolase family 28 protein, partial [Kiritimatiellia bacterium]
LRDKPDYTVRVQGKEVEVYSVPVNLEFLGHANFATCDMAGTVTVEVTVNFLEAAKINGVSVHPVSRGIKAQREGARFTFQVDRPGSLTLLVNGDHGLQPLHLFLCPPVEPPPPGAIVFGPGRHVVGGSDKPITLKSGQTLYLAPGAWVIGNVVAFGATNICIMGRGVLTPMPWPFRPGNWVEGPQGIWVQDCKDVRIEGIVLTRACQYWNMTLLRCDTVTLRDLHVLSPYGFSTDGCNPQGTRNLIVDRCFFRCNDDNMSIAGGSEADVPLNDCPPTENISVSNSVFWNGQGQALIIGLGRAKAYRNIKVQDCDVLMNSTGRGTFGISTKVEDVLFENIRVEYARDCLFHIGNPVVNEWGGKDQASDPRFVRGITFRNITVMGYKTRRNVIDCKAQDILIENLRYGDELILDAKAMGLQTNEWVRNLRIIGPEGKK